VLAWHIGVILAGCAVGAPGAVAGLVVGVGLQHRIGGAIAHFGQTIQAVVAVLATSWIGLVGAAQRFEVTCCVEPVAQTQPARPAGLDETRLVVLVARTAHDATVAVGPLADRAERVVHRA